MRGILKVFMFLIFTAPFAHGCQQTCVAAKQTAEAECDPHFKNDEIQGFERQAEEARKLVDQSRREGSTYATCMASADYLRYSAGASTARADHCTNKWKACYAACSAEATCLRENPAGAAGSADQTKLAQQNAIQCVTLRQTRVLQYDQDALDKQDFQFRFIDCGKATRNASL